MKHSQSGNILIFILLAIVLIGLLTVFLTRSSDTTNETGSYEQNLIAANNILRTAKSIEGAVQNLMARGCGENEISFWHDSDGNGTENASDDYFNPTAPPSRACHIFEAEGTGLSYNDIETNILDATQSASPLYGTWFFTGGSCIPNMASGDGTCAAELELEIMLILPWVRQDICHVINAVAYDDFANSAPIEEDDAYDDSALFIGDFQAPERIDTAANNISNQQSFCFQGQASQIPDGGFHFTYVLYAR